MNKMRLWLRLIVLYLRPCLSRRSAWIFILFSVIAFATTLGLSTDESKVYWLGIRQRPLEVFTGSESGILEYANTIYSTREFRCNIFYSEWYWTTWLLTMVMIWIPSVLTSLSRSLTPSGRLWQRMSLISPLEVVSSRLAAGSLVAFAFFVLESVWIASAAWLHGIWPGIVFGSVFCGFAYRLFTVQVIFGVNCVHAHSTSTIDSTVAAFSPVVLFLLGLGVTSGFKNVIGGYWPFVMPFRYLDPTDSPIIHATSLIAFGSLFSMPAFVRVCFSQVHKG